MKFVLSFLFASQTAFAGLPPTTLKGNKESSPATTFNFQLPFFQATTTAGVTRRIETGNGNRLVNPSFEASTPISGWTIASGTSGVSTSPVDGSNSYDLVYTSINGSLLQQSVAITSNEATTLQPVNFEASIYVGVNSSNVQLCALVSGVEKNCVAVPLGAPSQGLRKVTTYFQVTSVDTTMGLKLKTTTSDSASMRVDAAYVGVATIGTGYASAGPTSYTPTFVGFTASAVNCTYQQIQNYYDIYCRFTSASPTASTATMTLPLGAVADPATYTSGMSYAVVGRGEFTGSSGSTYFGGQTMLALGGSNFMYFGQEGSTGSAGAPGTGSAAVGSGTFVYHAMVAIQGLNPQTAIQTQNSNTSWASYTPDSATNQGMGTLTMKLCQWRHHGENMEGDCTFQTGTAAASEMRLALPTGYTTDSTKIATTPNGAGSASACGSLTRSGTTGASDTVVLCEPSKTYVTFAISSGTLGGLTKANGSTVVNSNEVVTVRFSVPISGWTENQNAPQLVGSVVNGGQGVTTAFTFMYAGATVTTDCPNGACTIYNNTGPSGLSVNNASAVYTVTVPAGTCGTTNLACTLNSSGAPAYSAPASAPTLTTFSWATYNTSFVSTNGHGVVHCECLK